MWMLIPAFAFLLRDAAEKAKTSATYGKQIAERQGVTAGDGTLGGTGLQYLAEAKAENNAFRKASFYGKAAKALGAYAKQETDLNSTELARLGRSERAGKAQDVKAGKYQVAIDAIHGTTAPTVEQNEIPFGLGLTQSFVSETYEPAPQQQASNPSGNSALVVVGLGAFLLWQRKRKR